MSRDADDPVPPRRPRPRPRDPNGEEPSTFQPNPRNSRPLSPSGRPGDGAEPPRPKPKQAGGGAAAGRTPPRTLDRPERVPEGPTWVERIVFGRVGTAQLGAFCRQFGAYLDAGVDLVKTLKSLEQQFARTALGPVIARVLQRVRGGDGLAEAFAREPQAFDPLFTSMMRVADARGGAPETLKMLAQHYDARLSLLRQARSAMIYPAAVLVIASAVVALLTIFVLPKFADLIKDIAHGASLPLPSRVLIGLSHFVQTGGWWMLPVAMIGTPIIVFQLYRTQNGKRLMDAFLMRIPVFGPLARKIDTTRLARTLATLFGAGVDVGSSIDLTADVLHLEPMRRAIRDAKSRVIGGEPLSDALRDCRWFGPDVIAVVESGEETGKLPEALEHLADDYEEQVQYMVRNLGQLVQPLIMIFLGGIVLFIILAVILPYIAILSSLGGG